MVKNTVLDLESTKAETYMHGRYISPGPGMFRLFLFDEWVNYNMLKYFI